MIWGETGLCHSSIIDINSITTVTQKVSYQPLARRELRCALCDSRFTLWLMNAIPYGSGRRPKSVGIVAKIIGWFQDSLVKLYQVPGSSLSLFQQRIFQRPQPSLYPGPRGFSWKFCSGKRERAEDKEAETKSFSLFSPLRGSLPLSQRKISRKTSGTRVPSLQWLEQI